MSFMAHGIYDLLHNLSPTTMPIKPPKSKPPKQPKEDSQPNDWTLLYIQTTQTSYQQRQDHTADIQQSIQDYESAAQKKISQDLGPWASEPPQQQTLPLRPKPSRRSHPEN
ncbi:hypothetical protein B0T21DRAFT_410941 [Apiosordaria backusii]|uniref:Uncharacterized protein n=1 Tax=Apiosordaria backusii TaxID=314023 RepID=A0AA40BNL7_9PEZI|nr:hypothetical protein B0T21DRAFT_410941 [Apiosordaria backusii]